MEEVYQIIGNNLKLKEETWGTNSHEKIIVNDIMAVRETASHLLEGFEDHSRAFLQVQNVCDHRCTFCTIAYGRRNSRSVPVGEIAAQTRTLVEKRYKQVVFISVDLASDAAENNMLKAVTV